jgi:CheY-like chemotaxis protein
MGTTDGLFEILLAEDSAADADLVREALKEHGVACALRIVRDGARAVEFIEALDQHANSPQLDLLLLDMHLPGQGGEDILRTLRSTENYGRTPVIVMTSSTSPRVREAAEKHAALHYFTKPSTLDEFMELGGIVKRILSGKRATSRCNEDPA